jgi:enoyl-CoA hydratase
MTRYLTYATEDDGRIAVISLNRPRQRNAQNRGLLVELDEAFRRAEADDAVRVVVLRGEGTAFSSGHDLGSSDDRAERSPGPGRHPSYDQDGGTRLGAERRMLQEWHYYFQNTKRWRDLRKITVASVHGPVISGGLMLMWACDLILAARGTTFADVVGTRLGMCGLEYFAHPWELGARKAKELLLTGDSIDADEAHRVGMVSKVFEPEQLEAGTLTFARRLAAMPTVTALLIKESVNQTVDQQGFHNALASCFSLHSLNHAHWAEVNPDGLPLGTAAAGLPGWREARPVLPARKSEA